MRTDHCPENNQLHSYLVGQINDEASNALELHIESCTVCQEKLDTLDNLLPNLPTSTGGKTLKVDEELAQLMDRAKRIPSGPSLENSTLGPYLLMELIGSGGMGRVYKALHQPMNRMVALKLLSPNSTQTHQRDARFRREAILAGSLKHPHIVTVHDANEIDGTCFMAMELIHGQDLAVEVKKHGPLTIEQTEIILRQTAEALAYAHAQGIVHRDLKPANLIRDEQGNIKLTDLGLARLHQVSTESEESSLTTSHIILGTANYMAPEQTYAPNSVGPAADIYSLGCTMVFLLTGEPPSNTNQYSGKWSQLIQSMLAKSPEDRPTAKDILNQLQKPSRIHRQPLALICVSLLLVLGGWLWLNRNDSSSHHEQSPVKPLPGPLKDPSIEMVRIPSGTFLMGSNPNDQWSQFDEKPQHKVAITRPFFLGKFEITQGQYFEVMGKKPWKQQGKVERENWKELPLESVSWLGAIEFCNQLSKKSGLPPYYQIKGDTVIIRGGNGYRLPTEAEWEYACRADSETAWSFGNDPKLADDFAWHAENAKGHAHPVGKKKPNAFGLFDMHGNVSEWCWDRYDPSFFSKSPVANPLGSGHGVTRIHRGGSWNHHRKQARSASRSTLGMFYGQTGMRMTGLRVARDLKDE